MEALTTQSDEWLPALDGDARALGLMKRHYSWRDYRDRRPHRLFVGPGEKMVLLSRDCRALFVWRRFIDNSGQQGVNCAVFRNEGEALSSQLIREAVALAWERWPRERLYTYVNAKKVTSPNPGYCFKQAGWNQCGLTKGGLVILELSAVDGTRRAVTTFAGSPGPILTATTLVPPAAPTPTYVGATPPLARRSAPITLRRVHLVHLVQEHNT